MRPYWRSAIPGCKGATGSAQLRRPGLPHGPANILRRHGSAARQCGVETRLASKQAQPRDPCARSNWKRSWQATGRPVRNAGRGTPKGDAPGIIWRSSRRRRERLAAERAPGGHRSLQVCSRSSVAAGQLRDRSAQGWAERDDSRGPADGMPRVGDGIEEVGRPRHTTGRPLSRFASLVADGDRRPSSSRTWTSPLMLACSADPRHTHQQFARLRAKRRIERDDRRAPSSPSGARAVQAVRLVNRRSSWCDGSARAR